jgi:putative tryptophan/tyrosine transport system substrate-binding protein
MRRRSFIGLVGGAAIARPLSAFAQRASQIRNIGILANFPADDPEGQARVNGFTHALEGLGWSEGMNLHTETRWAGDNAERYPQYARELVALKPDVILASASSSVAALQQVTHTVPIVFANVIDPVGAGFIASMAHPGGNTTGFTAFEYSISGKWLELLKQLTPGLTRVAVVREPSYAAGIGQFAAIQALALSSSSSSGIELTAIDPRNSDAIEPAIASFAREPNGGVIVTAGSSSVTHRAMLISLMLRYQLAAVYPFPYFSSAGGLVSYGPDTVDVHTRAANYVDRILKGERPADLPVQAPTRYRLAINLKTAKALGLPMPPSLVAIADEVIE